MKIYIPSRGRAGKVLTPKIFSPDLKANTIIVVPLDEQLEYLRHYSKEHTVLALDGKGIALTRRRIGEHAAAMGETTFCMMDDDLSFFVRSGEGTSLRKATSTDVDTMVYEMEMDLLEAGNVAHTSISTRQGNNNLELPAEYNTRTLRVLAYRTALFNQMQHERVPVMEDFDVNLQLLEAGYDNTSSHGARRIRRRRRRSAAVVATAPTPYRSKPLSVSLSFIPVWSRCVTR